MRNRVPDKRILGLKIITLDLSPVRTAVATSALAVKPVALVAFEIQTECIDFEADIKIRAAQFVFLGKAAKVIRADI